MFLEFFSIFLIIISGKCGQPEEPDVEATRHFLHRQMTTAERMATFGSPDSYHFEDTDGLTYFSTFPVDLSSRVKRKRETGKGWCPKFLRRRLKTPNGPLDLQLVHSQHIPPDLVLHIDNSPVNEKSAHNSSLVCSYRAKKSSLSASLHISGNKFEFLNGYFLQNGTIYGISPLPQRLTRRSTNPRHGPQHAVYRVRRQVDEDFFEDEILLSKLRNKMAAKKLRNGCAIDMKKECPDGNCRFDTTYSPDGGSNSIVHLTEGSINGRATLELGVFVDPDAYRIFSGYLGSDSALQNFLLMFIDQVDLIFHLPTFGNSVDVKLVYLNFLKSAQPEIPANADIEKTLGAFSNYQKNLNSEDDSDPQHWDHAVYLTGKKLYREKYDYSVMGMSRVGAMCDPLYSATIAELGATDSSKRPVQSSGFLSSYMVSHEIGHSLGLFHDGELNSCPTERNIMSPVRGWSGQTTWSSCSQDTLNQKLTSRSCLFDTNLMPMKMDFDFKKSAKLPGQEFTASAQCAIQTKDSSFFRDRDQSLSDICNSLQCRQVRSSSSISIGPALDGTHCGGKNWCSSGKCIAWPYDMPLVTPGWSGWTSGSCQSGCLGGSTGHQITQRFCNQPEPQNTEAYCQGDDHQVTLCSDSTVCGSRKSATEYATLKCTNYVNSGVPDIKPEGKQQPYESEKSADRSCAIYCKADDSNFYRHPKKAVAIMLGEEAFFPDGTLCNANGNYYCIDHQCVPSRR